MSEPPSARSRRVFLVKPGGIPFGAWVWHRNNYDGIVFRVGPLGHLQVQTYRRMIVGSTARKRLNRRGKHGVALHVWGVRGRRRKVGVEFNVIV